MKRKSYNYYIDAEKALRQLQKRIGGRYIKPKPVGLYWIKRPYILMENLNVKFVIAMYSTTCKFYIKPEKNEMD